MIAKTPQPPYYAVIFTSQKSENDGGYGEMAEKMVTLAAQQDGFLGMESARNEVGVTVSYWRDLECIKKWKQNTEHLEAQAKGRSTWYSHYKTRIARVERDYGFDSL